MPKTLTWLIIISTLLLAAITWLADLRIQKSTNNLVYNDLNKIPYNKTGLLLGTSKLLGNGQPNYYFLNRIKATIELFNAHKIDFVVISGDNSRKNYNEPLE